MKSLVFVFLLIQTGWAQPTDPSVRHANESDKAAIFGFMINARSAEMRGNTLAGVYRQCLLPAAMCGLLFPFYLRLSSRQQKPLTLRPPNF